MSPRHQHKFHFLIETPIVLFRRWHQHFKTSAHITEIQLCYLKCKMEYLDNNILQKYLIFSLVYFQHYCCLDLFYFKAQVELYIESSYCKHFRQDRYVNNPFNLLPHVKVYASYTYKETTKYKIEAENFLIRKLSSSELGCF